MKKIFFVLVALCTMMLIVPSCKNFNNLSSNNAEERIEAAKIAESREAKDLLNDLYLACDGDVESLARILQCTPSSIDRIRNDKTEPTLQFDEKIKSIAVFYYQNDRKFSKLQSALDPEYGWYDSILNFPSHHPWIFWIVNIILLLVLFFATLIATWPILLEMLIFLIAWIASLICAPDAIQDKYIDTVNPVIEQLV